jgi:hypothetical protein
MIPLLTRPIGVSVNCCEVKPVPSQFTDTSIAFPRIIPSPLSLAPPEPAFNPNGEVIYSPMSNGCIVEGPIAANANSPCALHVACSLVLQKPIVSPLLAAPCRGGVSASTSVTPVNIQTAPEPPSNQVNRAVPSRGQVPGSINVSIQSNATMAILVFGVILVGFYFISR